MRFSITLLILLFTISTSSAAVTPAKETSSTVVEVSAADLTRDAVEAKLGRKLKFKERVALSIARGKVKRAERRKARSRGGATDGLAIASFVCGVLGLFIFFTAIPALVLGIISLGRYSRGEYYTGKGLAIAGVVMGGVVVFLFLLLVGLFALAFGAA